MLLRWQQLEARDDLPPAVDVILVEAGPSPVRTGLRLVDFLKSLPDRPVVALCDRANEHQGIAAVRAGADAYICIDDVTVEDQDSILDHVVRRFKLARRLSETDTSVLSILGSINDGAIVVDRSGHVLEINPAARSMLGLRARWMPDPDWEQTFCCYDEKGKSYRNLADLPLVRARNGNKFESQVSIYRAPEQPDTYLNINGQGLYDGDGALIGGVITFRDITDLKRRATELEDRAQFDALTNLPNRAAFIDQLRRGIGRSQRKAMPLAVLFIDLDRFKSVNDTLGHDAGDDVLRQVGERLQRNLRIGDTPARWGGDEFVVCLEDFGEMSNAGAAAQKLLLVLSERYEVMNSEVFATPSIGIALCPDSGDDAERLVKAAEIAMHEARKRGGGRFQYYSNALNSHLEQREELEVGLRHALVRDEFVLHYQPRIDVTTGRLIGLEALLRWQHPRFGLLQPDRFVPILESSGLIHSAGEWVIATATRQLAVWQRQFEMPDLSIAINVSPQQLAQSRIIDTVAAALDNTQLDPGCVELEIGDGNLSRRRDAEVDALRSLRRLGVRLSLDKFGTRDISFESLERGYVDSFVLDQSLIADVETNDSHQRIVRAAIAMAQGMDIEVAAEGVETLTQLEFLRSCNCDLAQGFLISRPMQSEKVSSILRSEIAGTRLLTRGMP
jgi:diguanylate cyclase (GGDEF)-like protein/PAS domain S-box-containing protein